MLMEAIIYLWGFKFCFDSIKTHSQYKWILIEDSTSHKSVPEGYFDEIYFADFSSFSESDKIVEELQKRYKIKAIVATMEKVIEIGGWLRSKYNIPGVTYEESICLRNKSAMKNKIRQSGINTAKSAVIESKNEFLACANNFGFPIIVKPIDGYGTVDTFKLSNESELHKHARENDFTIPMLVEEFIIGEEYHCDSIVNDNNVVFSSVGKYFFPLLETINEQKLIGSIIYPETQNPIINAIKKFNEQSINALNIKNGLAHAEYFVKPNGQVYFGELAVRIGGGALIADCIKNTYGINLFDAFIDVEIRNFNHNKYKTTGRNIYTAFVCFPSKNGTIQYISNEEDLRHIKGVVKIYFRNKIGDKISEKLSSASRTGYAILEDENIDTLKQNVIELMESFRLDVL